MQNQKRWIELEADEKIVQQLQTELNIHPVLCKLLVLRNIKTFDEAKDFFRPNLNKLHDPFLMRDMDKAITRIETAIANNERILIYGDYDVDGTTAVSLVYSYFNDFYDNICYYIPDRYTEGYGISFQGIDFAKDNNVSLIIALDCGIKANDKVDYANERNIDFIICDHHLPGDVLPNAVAVLDPKRNDCSYPFDELSGCGIGFKLIQAYAEKNKLNAEKIYDQLDLVAVSIASDLVPITGENRILAKFGCDRINQNPRAGIKALMSELKLSRNLDITDLVFIIGPRINAAGRIAHGSEAVTLLIENDYDVAIEKTKKVQQNNTDRKTIDKDITDEAFAMIDNNETLIHKKTTVLYQEHWHKGVVGIVASRMIEKYYRPTIILASSNGKAVGSGRSVPGFDLYDAIDSCSEHLVQFGGHKYAAGLTIELDKIQDFSDAFEKIVRDRITADQQIPQVEIDAEIELTDINDKFFNILEQMQPFGPGNMRPTFVTKDVYDTGYSKVLNGNHLKLNILKDGQSPKNGVGFGMGNYMELMEQKETVDICYQLYANEWNNQIKIEFKLKDLR
ncbi:MAG: single-stranded-DNA-specific exonuclease RecJ, partial [Chitinophagales bacterium]|jgi:single-stranded-DNA-specific exonuclease|nr:single-stranded-DNA-specific exonuclease RecJ [Chitinophagales bacterium]